VTRAGEPASHKEHRPETVQNLGGLTLLAGRGTLADADLVHLNGAIGSGQLHRDPPPHLAPGLLGWRLSVAPSRFWTVSMLDLGRPEYVRIA
jgi:hypothetical protein